MYSKDELGKMYQEGFECECEAAGFCPIYNKTMGNHIHNLCKTNPNYRTAFVKQRLADMKIDAEMDYTFHDTKDKHKIDRAIIEMRHEGVTLESDEKSKGLGDTVEKILGKMGITQKMMEKVLGMKDCGCNQRKEWLNKIFSYKSKKNDGVPKEEE